MINRLAYLKKLEAVGLSRNQAEAQVELVVEAFNDNFATKEDVALSKLALQTDLAKVRSEFSDVILKIETMENRLLIKLGSGMLALFTIFFSVFTYIIKFT